MHHKAKTRHHSVFNKRPMLGHEPHQHELWWKLLIPEEEMVWAKITDNLLSCSSCGLWTVSLCWLLTDLQKNMCLQFSDTQIYSPVRPNVHLWRPLSWTCVTFDKRTHWWASVKLPGHSVGPKSTAQVTLPPRSRLEKCAPTVCVFDSWLDLHCHISLTPHVPVFGAIKTNKTLPRSGCPPSPFQKTQLKQNNEQLLHVIHTAAPWLG